MSVQQPTWRQNLFETMGISRHLEGAPGGPSAHNRGPLPPLPTPVNSTSLTQVNSASLIHKLNTALTDRYICWNRDSTYQIFWTLQQTITFFKITYVDIIYVDNNFETEQHIICTVCALQTCTVTPCTVENQPYKTRTVENLFTLITDLMLVYILHYWGC